MLFNKWKTKKKNEADEIAVDSDNDVDKKVENSIVSNREKNLLHLMKNNKVKTAIVIFVVLVLSVRLYFNNERVKGIVESSVYNSLDRKIEIGKLKYSILFTKVYLSDVVFYNSEKFKENENIKLDNFRVRFSFFSLFALKLKIKEITIDNLYVDIFANEKGELSIFDFPPSKPKVEKESKPFDLKKLDLLKFKVDIANIRLNNLSVKMDGITENKTKINKMFFSLDDLNFHLDILTKRFSLSKITTIDVLDMLNKLDLKLFLADNKNISFKAYDNSFVSKPVFDLSLEYLKELKDIKVLFNIDVDKSSKVVLNKNTISNFQFAFNIDTLFSTESKNININDISSMLYSDKIIDIKANVTDTLTANPSIDIQKINVDLYLDKIEQIADVFMPDMNFKLNGHIALGLKDSKGSVSNIQNTILLSTDNVIVYMLDFLKIEKLNSSNVINYNFNQKLSSRDDIKINANINMALFHLTFLPEFRNMQIALASKSSLNGIANFLPALFDGSVETDTMIDIKKFSFDTADGNIAINGLLAFEDNLDLNLDVNSISLTTLTDNFLRGRLSIGGKIKGKLLTSTIPELKGNIKNFSYNLSGDISSTANSSIDLACNVNIMTGDLELSKLNFSIGNFLNLKMKAMLSGYGMNGAYVKIDNLRIAPYSIKSFLSPNLAAIISGMPFEDDINTALSLEFKNYPEKNKMSVTNYTLISITEEAYNLKEIAINIDTDIDLRDSMLVNIKKFSVISDNNNLEVSALGDVSTDISKCNVSYKFAVNSEAFYLPFMELGGIIDISGRLKDSIAEGKIFANHFYLDQRNASNSVMYINDFNMDSDYSFSLKNDLTTIKQVPVRYTPLTTPIANMTFKEFRLYLQVPPFIDDVIRIVDFNANLDIKKDTILIRELKSSLYIGGNKFDSDVFFQSISNNTAPRRGAIYMPWISLNLNDFKSRNIRYDMRVLGSDINFKYLLPPDSRERIDDEKLLVNLTADIAGIGVSPLNAIKFNTFFFGISKMSTELSKFIIELIKPINPGIEKVENVVQFGYDPNAVEFSISDNKVNTTFYFRDQNLDKKKQQKLQLVAFEGDKFGLEPMSFSDIISYLEKQ